MKKTLLLAAAVVATFAANASAQYSSPEVDAWGEDNKEWECAMPIERLANGTITNRTERNPVYKTEIYLMRNDPGTTVTAFNVRHTLRNGDPYQRADQYEGIRVRDWKTGKRTGTQQWSGYSVKYPGLRMVGELRWTQTGRDSDEGGYGLKATYTEWSYRDGKIQSQSTSTCHWVGPGC